MTISSTFVFSLSGLNAARDRVAVSANNLANSLTAGFKAQRALQSDVKTGGTQVSAIDSMTMQGPMMRTGGPLDLAVAGNGFFAVQKPAGGVFYTRDGNFHVDGQGRIVDAGGNFLQPPMTVPAGAGAIQATSDGRLSAVMPDGALQPMGQIGLARFANPGGLVREGENLLARSGNSGDPVMGAPGTGGMGLLTPGALEGSNVDIAGEMVEQMVDLRAFQASTKPIKAADEMLGSLLDLKH